MEPPRCQRRGRIIPARAENTWSFRAPRSRKPDHPRSRGEHQTSYSWPWAAAGSSPLARGTLVAGSDEGDSKRIIPARAGNTGRTGRSGSPGTDHPRSRGEHGCTLCHTRLYGGSSPLARGTRPPLPCTLPGERIIPARAGNTGNLDLPAAVKADHPRSRGEHTMPFAPNPDTTGSSPLARGTHQQTLRRSERIRIIPARAGNTPSTDNLLIGAADHPRSRGEHT